MFWREIKCSLKVPRFCRGSAGPKSRERSAPHSPRYLSSCRASLGYGKLFSIPDQALSLWLGMRYSSHPSTLLPPLLYPAPPAHATMTGSDFLSDLPHSLLEHHFWDLERLGLSFAGFQQGNEKPIWLWRMERKGSSKSEAVGTFCSQQVICGSSPVLIIWLPLWPLEDLALLLLLLLSVFPDLSNPGAGLSGSEPLDLPLTGCVISGSDFTSLCFSWPICKISRWKGVLIVRISQGCTRFKWATVGRVLTSTTWCVLLVCSC